MSLTVKSLIEKYSAVQESESNPEDFNVKDKSIELTEEESKVLSALNMGVVTKKVLNERKLARNK